MKLVVGALYKNLGRVRIWGYSPLGAHPQKCGVGYDVGEISAGCPVVRWNRLIKLMHLMQVNQFKEEL